MIKLEGKYNTAKVFTDKIESTAKEQIINLLNQPLATDSNIRIMPDVHAGKGCTIGTTMTIKDKVVPNLVGVDIGCGMLAYKLSEREIDLQKLDEVIKQNIPSGFNVRTEPVEGAINCGVEKLRCIDIVDYQRALLSLGTLGGGNHFIEVDKDDEGCLYLIVHTGSRGLGLQVAKHYQEVAVKQTEARPHKKTSEIINKLKSEGRHTEIQKELKKQMPDEQDIDFAYLEGKDFDDYIHDMKIAQNYASQNRCRIVYEIIWHMGLELSSIAGFETIHNYIDTETMILRKGAVSAKKDEQFIVPLNMRDGSLICVGKGNADWNYSAPHGAGRIMSRTDAFKAISFDDFQKSMDGIYSSTINSATIDESAFAYKPMEEIINNISETADIIKIIKPIYNFKNAETQVRRK